MKDMTTTAIQHWECHVPKSASLYFVDYNESLDQHEDLQEKCIRQNSMLPLDEESSEWYSEQFTENLRAEMRDIKESMEKAGLGGEYAENEDNICDMLYDRNDTYPAEGLIRNTSTTTMFYSLGLEIEGYQYGKCHRSQSEAYWCNRIRQILRLRKGQYDDRILEMLMAATYGGELRIYFNAMFNDLVSEEPEQDFKTIRFYGDVVVAIADSCGGSGDHTTLPIDITLPFNRDNLFVDSQVHYSYADEVCGMVHDWCDSTKWETGMKPIKKKLNKSHMTEHQRQEAEYVKTFRKGGCTTGDINISRHRDVYYIKTTRAGTNVRIAGHSGSIKLSVMAQERIDDWWEYAKDLARAERELQIERWVYISIEYKDEAGRKCRLHSYDLPRELHERYRWVIRWREARLQCQYPRENINTYYSYYDKRTGLRTDFNSCLMKLAAAKAQITRAERKEAEYLAYQRQNNLFFDEQTDEQLLKFRQKLRTKKEIYHLLAERIQTAVATHKASYTG